MYKGKLNKGIESKMMDLDMNQNLTTGFEWVSTQTTLPDSWQEFFNTTVAFLIDKQTLGPTKELEGIMRERVQLIINLTDFIIIQAIVLVCGLFANIMNIYAFFQIGLTDTVTISFFALSISDMLCLLIAVYNWLCYVLYRVSDQWPVDMFGLMYLGVWYFQMIYDVSMLITTYTAVQKCCCVALPLKFKNVFTAYRTVVVIILIWIFCVICYIPMLVTQGLEKRWIAKTNTTLLVPWFSHAREEATAANDIIIRIILQNVSQLIVLICLIILNSTLRKQSKFRLLAASYKRNVPQNRDSNTSIEKTPSTKSKQENKENRITSKELQVIKSVTLVSTLFVVGNFPRIVLSCARTAVPELDTFKRYHNLHLSLSMMRRVIEVSSMSANFIIYFKFNSRFREIVSKKFGCCKKNGN